jgi:hypothetical protein
MSFIENHPTGIAFSIGCRRAHESQPSRGRDCAAQEIIFPWNRWKKFDGIDDQQLAFTGEG